MTAIEVAIGAPAADIYQGPGKPSVREFDWHHIAETAPTLAATMLRYLDQIALSLRPSSVRSAEGILRGFAGYLTANHPASLPEIKALLSRTAWTKMRSSADAAMTAANAAEARKYFTAMVDPG